MTVAERHRARADAPHRRKGRAALAAALAGVALFVGSWFVTGPLPGTSTVAARDVLSIVVSILWLTALALGLIGWRTGVSAKAAVGIALGLPALIVFVAATATWQ